MLKFHAEKFVRMNAYLSQMEIAALGAIVAPPQDVSDDIKARLLKTKELCNAMGLKWTERQVARALKHFSLDWPDEASSLLKECRIRLEEELADHVFVKLDDEKISFANEDWLIGTAIEANFPSTISEFQRAGRCYAYDENTACMFHLMRVLDFGFRSVGKSLGIVYDARNWQGLRDVIDSEMSKKYQQKSADWKKAEPAYAEILTDMQAIARGHRNPVLHELEKKYEPKEAHYMLTVVEGFISHLAKNGFKE